MEYFQRGSLRPYIGRMTLAQIGGVFEDLLAGLMHAESQGVVHRDLKPENLMVTADGRVTIADSGIAEATTTPAYMAPEQALGQEIGSWTDLYSVGCIAFELFTGHVPFHDSDAPMAILLRHVNEPIPPVKALRPDVDARISAWIERLLVKEPGQRTQNAGDAWRELEQILVVLLGPFWRREAGLVADGPEGARRHTTSSVLDAGTDEFETFASHAGWPAFEAPIATPPTRLPELTPTPVAPTPEDSAPVGERPRWVLPTALAGYVAAVAMAVAIALNEPATTATASAPRTPAAFVTLFTAGIALEVPAGWLRETGGAPGVEGIDDGLAAGGPTGAIVVGKADKTAFNATLLPDSLRANQRALTAEIGGDEQALRYDDLPVAGRSATVYSVPTTEGVATLACFAQAETCSRIASTMQITEGKAFALGADATFLNDVERILSRLEAREQSAAARLERAGDPATQLAATKKLWWGYLGAAKALRQLDVSPADSELRTRLARILRAAGCAYGRAAAHGGRNDGAGYQREADLALAQQTPMTSALDGLVDAGYRLPAGATQAATFTRLPALIGAEA